MLSNFSNSLKRLAPLLLIFTLLFSVVLSAPTSGSSINALEARKPAFPSLDDCRNKITAPAKDKAMYFTGLKTRKDVNAAKKYATDHGLTHVTNCYPTGWTDRGNYDGDDTQFRQFQKDFSQAYAEKTEGIAYLMLDDGKTPADDSVFQTIEFPKLRDGAKCTKILQFPFTNPPDDPEKDNKRYWPDYSGHAPQQCGTGGC